MPPVAMILAAGLGTRLNRLSTYRPKAMLSVAGTALCRWTVLWLRHHGVNRMVVNLHHLGDQIEAELGDGSALGVEIRYSKEDDKILGTGGGIRHARSLLEEQERAPIVVVNAKILTDLNLRQVLAHHRLHEAEATMVLRPDPEAERWGSLRLAGDGRVARLLGARPAQQPNLKAVSEPLMFTGVHVIEPRFLDRIPDAQPSCVIRTAYRSLFDEGHGLMGVRTDDYWWEHSTEERYLQGVINVLDGTATFPFADHCVAGVDVNAYVSPQATITAPVYIGPGAVVEAGARVGPYVQIDAGARVEAGASVQRAVVWEGAVVSGVVRDAVVTP